jgi:hypothetical protein
MGNHRRLPFQQHNHIQPAGQRLGRSGGRGSSRDREPAAQIRRDGVSEWPDPGRGDTAFQIG